MCTTTTIHFSIRDCQTVTTDNHGTQQTSRLLQTKLGHDAVPQQNLKFTLYGQCTTAFVLMASFRESSSRMSNHTGFAMARDMEVVAWTISTL